MHHWFPKKQNPLQFRVLSDPPKVIYPCHGQAPQLKYYHIYRVKTATNIAPKAATKDADTKDAALAVVAVGLAGAEVGPEVFDALPLPEPLPLEPLELVRLDPPVATGELDLDATYPPVPVARTEELLPLP